MGRGLNKPHEDFCDRVLGWVMKMQAGPTRFRMNEGADSTVFTSCFALFIFDLFGQVDNWTQREKDMWIEYINSFQDKNTGYFIPDKFQGELDTKPVQQLTCFCLSALGILGARPGYKLSFLKRWNTPGDVHVYLKKTGCFDGKPMTGNMAMFLAIFLTYQYKNYGDESALKRLDAWFHWHEEAQNKSTGFWGNSLRNRYYLGFQNSLHQYGIYNYWNRQIPHNTRIVDTVLSLQDKDGFFAPIPGGGGCWDFDAIDILINCGYKRGYRKKDVESALIRAFFAILESQNNDGGFCESRKRPASLKHVLKNTGFVSSGRNPYLWYFRLRTMLSVSRKKREKIFTHWTERGRLWGQSDLWNTWFRCLTLAEISESIEFDNPLKHLNWKFHNVIGLGYFQKP